MDEMFRSCVAGKLEIVVSAIWRLEVLLDTHLESHQVIENAFENGTILSAAATDDVFMKSLEVRRLLPKKTLQTADLIHVATAIQTGCSTLYSLDNHILRCSGSIPGLHISKPESEAELFDEAESLEFPSTPERP
jgi:predicted nucleic acid-binding protein